MWVRVCGSGFWLGFGFELGNCADGGTYLLGLELESESELGWG